MDKVIVELGGRRYRVTGADFYSILTAVKAQEGRRYDPIRKLWVVPGEPEMVIRAIEGFRRTVNRITVQFNLHVEPLTPSDPTPRRPVVDAEGDVSSKGTLPEAEFGIGELGRIPSGEIPVEPRPFGKLTGRRCDRCGRPLGQYDAMMGSLGTYCPDCYDIAESEA